MGVGCGFKEKKSFIFFRFFSSYILVAGCWKETTHVYPHKNFFFFLYFFLFFFRGTCYHVGWLVRAFCADDVNYSILSFSSSFVFIVFLYTRQYASSTINIQIWTFKKQKKKQIDLKELVIIWDREDLNSYSLEARLDLSSHFTREIFSRGQIQNSLENISSFSLLNVAC